MNEVGLLPVQGQASPRAISLAGENEVKSVEQSGKVLPSADVNATEASAPNGTAISETESPVVQDALDSVNTYIQAVQRDLEFSVDAELDKTVIKVVDSGSGEVIRQIPGDVFLEMARNLKEEGQLNLVDALG